MREHGYARYRLDGCRCQVCKSARYAYDRNRDREIQFGDWRPFIDATPVRAHLVALRAAGIGERQIHLQSGVSRTVIAAIIRGRRGSPPSARVRRETGEAILALAAAGHADGAVVDGTGTARRVQALCAIGWSLTSQAGRIGWAISNYARLATGGPVTARTARAVGDLYDDLSMTPAPAGYSATRARNLARSRGWVVPLAWDDDEIDDPAAVPATGTDGGRRSAEDFAADYRMLTGQGFTHLQIAERLGMSISAVNAQIGRAGLAVAS